MFLIAYHVMMAQFYSLHLVHASIRVSKLLAAGNLGEGIRSIEAPIQNKHNM